MSLFDWSSFSELITDRHATSLCEGVIIKLSFSIRPSGANMHTSSSQNYPSVSSPCSSLWVQSARINEDFRTLPERNSLQTRFAFSNFLTEHVSHGSLLSTAQVAVAPGYSDFKLLSQVLNRSISRLRESVQLSITLEAGGRMSSSEEVIQQYQAQLQQLLHGVIAEGKINSTTLLLQKHNDAQSVLVTSLSRLTIDSVVAAETAGLTVDEFCIGFDLIPAGPARLGPTAAWHNHRHVRTPDFKKIREDQFDLTTIFVPVGPTSLIAEVPSDSSLEVPVFSDLVATFRSDPFGLRKYLSKQIYDLEGGHEYSLRTWSPRRESCLLFAPEAVHRAPLPLRADTLSSAESVYRALGAPIPYNRAMISVTLLVNRRLVEGGHLKRGVS